MDWETSTSGEIASMIPQEVCIVPIGCLERHADHLPAGCDGLIAHGLARRVAEREPCMVLPPLYYALHAGAKNAVGGVFLPTILFLQCLEAVCDDVGRTGFRKVLLLNAHGGNTTTLDAFRRMIADRHKDYAVFLPPLFPDEQAIRNVQETDLCCHACEIETSIALYLFPEHVRTGAIPDRASGPLKDFDVASARMQLEWYATYPDQYAGDARAASAEKGRIIVQAQVDAFVDIVRKIKADRRALELLAEYRKDAAAPRATVSELTHGRRS